MFSLAKLRKIKEEGVYFNSHIDGHKIFMGPEQSMQIQSNLASVSYTHLSGWNSRFHGNRKEGADKVCGIMKKDSSIL